MKCAKPKKNTKAGKNEERREAILGKIVQRRRRAAERIAKDKFLSFDELRQLLAVTERKREGPFSGPLPSWSSRF